MRLSLAWVLVLLTISGCTGGEESQERESDIGEEFSITFSRSDHIGSPGGTLTVVSMQDGNPLYEDLELSLEDCRYQGTDRTGRVRAGDTIVCSADGPLTITYRPQNLLLYRTTFGAS